MFNTFSILSLYFNFFRNKKYRLACLMNYRIRNELQISSKEILQPFFSFFKWENRRVFNFFIISASALFARWGVMYILRAVLRLTNAGFFIIILRCMLEDYSLLLPASEFRPSKNFYLYHVLDSLYIQVNSASFDGFRIRDIPLINTIFCIYYSNK